IHSRSLTRQSARIRARLGREAPAVGTLRVYRRSSVPTAPHHVRCIDEAERAVEVLGGVAGGKHPAKPGRPAGHGAPRGLAAQATPPPARIDHARAHVRGADAVRYRAREAHELVAVPGAHHPARALDVLPELLHGARAEVAARPQRGELVDVDDAFAVLDSHAVSIGEASPRRHESPPSLNLGAHGLGLGDDPGAETLRARDAERAIDGAARILRPTEGEEALPQRQQRRRLALQNRPRAACPSPSGRPRRACAAQALECPKSRSSKPYTSMSSMAAAAATSSAPPSRAAK